MLLPKVAAFIFSSTFPSVKFSQSVPAILFVEKVWIGGRCFKLFQTKTGETNNGRLGKNE